MNPIQKCPHIIELSACILNMFVLMFFLSNEMHMNMVNPKRVKINNFIILYIATQCVPTSAYSSMFIIYASHFIALGKLSLL